MPTLLRWFSLPTLLFLTFSLLASSSSFASRKTPDEYWKRTKLSFGHVAGMIHSKNCYQTEKAFLSCMLALNAGGRTAYPAFVFASREQITEGVLYTGEVMNFLGPLAAVGYFPTVLPKDLKSSAEAVKYLKDARDRELRGFTLLYFATYFKPIDFTQLVQYMRSHLIFSGDEAVIAARIINTLLASAMDPHSYIKSEEELDDEMNPTDDGFAGIGLRIRPVRDRYVIESPLEGSPALAAGLRARDIILSVGGESADRMSYEQLVEKIRGKEGTKVVITVLRNGQTLSIEVTRAKILIPNIQVSLLNYAGKEPLKLGYLKLQGFMDPSGCTKIRSALPELEKAGAKGLILDLRFNGGGLLDQAVCMGGLFVGRKVIAQTADLQTDEITSIPAKEEAVTQLPMVTLVNAYSASASEILAGALQDYGRSWIAGERSFGKGTVQGSFGFFPGVLLFKTVQQFYLPSNRTTLIVGIEPDFPLDPKPDATEEDRFALREIDQYVFAPPEVENKWVQPRPEKVTAIRNCVSKQGTAAKLYADMEANSALAPDFQLLAAQDILACELKPVK